MVIFTFGLATPVKKVKVKSNITNYWFKTVNFINNAFNVETSAH